MDGLVHSNHCNVHAHNTISCGWLVHSNHCNVHAHNTISCGGFLRLSAGSYKTSVTGTIVYNQTMVAWRL